MTDPALLSRVRALLAKAESTTFEAEADALTAKAQELITKYAIDQTLVDAADPARADNRPGQREVPVNDPYASAKALLLGGIAHANRAKAVWSSQTRSCFVVGFPDDLDAIDLLFTSLLVQATSAMVAAGPQVDRGGRSRTRSFRHSFLVSFASRISERLQEASRSAIDDAVAEYGADLLPVLANRDELVEQTFQEEFPQLRKMGTRVSNGAGWTAGRIAADQAHLHTGKPISRR